METVPREYNFWVGVKYSVGYFYVLRNFVLFHVLPPSLCNANSCLPRREPLAPVRCA